MGPGSESALTSHVTQPRGPELKWCPECGGWMTGAGEPPIAAAGSLWAASQPPGSANAAGWPAPEAGNTQWNTPTSIWIQSCAVQPTGQQASSQRGRPLSHAEHILSRGAAGSKTQGLRSGCLPSAAPSIPAPRFPRLGSVLPGAARFCPQASAQVPDISGRLRRLSAGPGSV